MFRRVRVMRDKSYLVRSESTNAMRESVRCFDFASIRLDGEPTSIAAVVEEVRLNIDTRGIEHPVRRIWVHDLTSESGDFS
jgi:hypothetical protein